MGAAIRKASPCGARFCGHEGPWSRLSLMANAKQEVFKLLEILPEEASLEDIQYHLYVLQCIGRGRQDVEAGRTLPQDEAERRMARWLEK